MFKISSEFIFIEYFFLKYMVNGLNFFCCNCQIVILMFNVLDAIASPYLFSFNAYLYPKMFFVSVYRALFYIFFIRVCRDSFQIYNIKCNNYIHILLLDFIYIFNIVKFLLHFIYLYFSCNSTKTK